MLDPLARRGLRWPLALLYGSVLLLLLARWLPATMRDLVPYAVALIGLVGAAMLMRSQGGIGWKAVALVVALPFWLLALGVIWPEPQAPLPQRVPDRYLIERVRVVDVAAGTVSQPTHIEVAGGVIRAIGGKLPPADLPRIDAADAYAVPGFWDMHVHSFVTTPQLHHALMLSHGVTSVRDMMDCAAPRDPLVACIADKKRWSAEAERGDRAGPRYVSLASFYFDDPALTPEDARSRADAFIRAGATEIKVYNRVSLGAYRALADVSAQHGVPISGHLPRAVPLSTALTLGQRRFEHARLLPDSCGPPIDYSQPALQRTQGSLAGFDARRCAALIARMAQVGATLVPTHVTREDDLRAHAGTGRGLEWLDPLSRWAWNDDAAGTRTAYPGRQGAAMLSAYHRRGMALTGAAHRAGVRILVGTDAVPAGPRYHDELALLSKAGLSSSQILRAATLSAAQFAGRDRTLGSIAPGKTVDLVLLRTNPLENIAATRQIDGLIFSGRLYRRPDLLALNQFTLAQANHPANWAKMLWGFLTSPSASEL